MDYSKYSFKNLVKLIGASRYWDLPPMLEEVFNKIDESDNKKQNKDAFVTTLPLIGEISTRYVLPNNTEWYWNGIIYVKLSTSSSGGLGLINTTTGNDTDNSLNVKGMLIDYDPSIQSQNIGENSLSTGAYSTALGNYSKALGASSVAIGLAALASEVRSTAIGTGTIADGIDSSAFGYNSETQNEKTTSIGAFSKANAVESTSLGMTALATKDYATALGSYSQATGLSTTSTGAYSNASGNYSTAVGCLTQASALNSTSVGSNANASGDRSTSIGVNSISNGSNSLALGSYAEAPNIYSIALGSDVNTTSNNQLAISATNGTKAVRFNTNIPQDLNLNFPAENGTLALKENSIPLTGTTINKPVTGDIEVNSYFRIYSNNVFENTGMFLEFAEDRLNIGANRLSANPTFTKFKFTPINIILESSFINSRGIVGQQNFSPNITDLDYTQKIYVDTKVAESKPYKVYTAIINQTSTNAPVATILQDDFGDIVFSRGGSGYYVLDSVSTNFTGSNVWYVFKNNSTNDFIDNKTSYMVKDIMGGSAFIIQSFIFNGMSNQVQDSIIIDASLEIRVYN